jgi:hypothetical protein
MLVMECEAVKAIVEAVALLGFFGLMALIVWKVL